MRAIESTARQVNDRLRVDAAVTGGWCRDHTDCPLSGCQRDDALRRVNAALEEQARAIGQALHDESGHALTAAHIALAEAYDLADPPVRVHLTELRSHLDAVAEHLRQIAYELRPRILDDLGLVAALRFLSDGMEARGDVSVTFAARVERPIPAVVETAVYRLAQEAFTNIRRHSGATRIALELEERPDGLRCRIRDNGSGFELAAHRPSSLGLVGIHDRLRALGATLTIALTDHHETELAVLIPLEARDGSADSAR